MAEALALVEFLELIDDVVGLPESKGGLARADWQGLVAGHFLELLIGHLGMVAVERAVELNLCLSYSSTPISRSRP